MPAKSPVNFFVSPLPSYKKNPPAHPSKPFSGSCQCYGFWTGRAAAGGHLGRRGQECHHPGPGMEKGHQPEGGDDAPHRQHQQADPQGPQGGA